MKDLKNELFSIMSPEQIKTLFDDMFESYVRESNDIPSKTADVHHMKRTIVAIVNKLYNER